MVEDEFHNIGAIARISLPNAQLGKIGKGKSKVWAGGRAQDVEGFDQMRMGAEGVERGVGGVEGDVRPDKADKGSVPVPGDTKTCEEGAARGMTGDEGEDLWQVKGMCSRHGDEKRPG